MSRRRRVDGAGGSGRASWALRFAMGGMATIGMTSVRAAGFTVSDLFFLVASSIVAGGLLSGARRGLAPPVARRTSPMLLVGMCVLTVGGLLATMARSWDPMGSLLVIVRLWYVTIFWFWCLRAVVTSVRDLYRLLAAFVVGCLINGFVGIFQEATGANAGYPGWGRSLGLTDHYNSLGTALAAAVPLALLWQPYGARTRRSDQVRLVVVLLLFAGIGVSGSMTAFGSAVVGVAVSLALGATLGVRSGSARTVLYPMLGMVAGAVLLVAGVVDLPVLERFTKLREGNSYITDSAESRGEMATIAMQGAVESPLVGVGLDSESGRRDVTDDRSVSTHSLFLRLVYEAGILGLVGLAIVLLAVCRQCTVLLFRTVGSRTHWVSIGLVGSVVAVCTNALFSPILYERFFWVSFGLVGVIFGLARAAQPDAPVVGLPSTRR